jgi:hypothetical protein
MTRDEVNRLEGFLRKTFGVKAVEVRRHPKKSDFAEVYLNDEFIATIYRDDEDGDVSYQFQMAILEDDLNEA